MKYIGSERSRFSNCAACPCHICGRENAARTGIPTFGVRWLPFHSLPAAGYRNNDNLNNAGSNGNYWSSSLNTDNTNAYNMNFNSDNVNTNNNNRNNGQSVRPVSESTPAALPFATSPSQLLADLYAAYRDARKHKRKKDYQLSFERNLESELARLRDSIITGRYSPGVSTCFIIHDPKMREVFAATFRDRVVHHLLYNYIRPFLEPQFIEDSYSCIKGRGTHYGIKRLEHHIREVSHNYSRSCFVLKMDISGYFMHIDREVLLDLCRKMLLPYRDRMDWPLVDFLLQKLVLYDAADNCIRLGREEDWTDLPEQKSLFNSPPGCGLPIGNLTSQLFSNVYLNGFDRYDTEKLGFTHYGRYVDDFYIVSNKKEELREAIPKAAKYLSENLCLSLSERKTGIHSAYMGVEFLGAYLKPFRKYVGNECKRRMRRKMYPLSAMPPKRMWSAVNSYLGLTSHYSAYNIRKDWISNELKPAFGYGCFTNGILKYKLYKTDHLSE